MRSKFYANKDTGNPAALVFHAIPFAACSSARYYERPAAVVVAARADPAARHRFAAAIRRQAGVLERSGKPPLLFDAGKRELGPLFVGVSQVNIRKRFDLYRIFAQVADRMGEFYDNRIKG